MQDLYANLYFDIYQEQAIGNCKCLDITYNSLKNKKPR